MILVSGLNGINMPTAIAGLKDDRYEGDIFTLYAGNGSLVPPKVTLEQALERKRPTILVFYLDDNSDSKQYSTVVSQLQAFYGRTLDLIALRVDAIPPKKTYAKTEAGYYYSGVVPQTVLFDETGKVVLNQKGSVAYEQIDDVLRKVFKLLPRSESVELRRQPVNEFNTELIP
ncbi:thylakoid membrane photosystem I accumulation factor [Leptolyngbya sp. Cla-17]|uniref:thylakoid membrane photosystem I accumulation factor n=1 Tax=Leptolyngbya sp. Cla-17 TaxID=2803751 RepID=UPI001FD94797|nr:thylakoid membrane photosystem I accumulation factor [Leptolyngbya sp. Cla-17]